jgi:hypothetical protein
METRGHPATMAKIAIDELAISEMRKFETAIIKNAIIKNNILKFGSVESAIRKDDMLISAP